jgi:hypothetical protein
LVQIQLKNQIQTLNNFLTENNKLWTRAHGLLAYRATGLPERVQPSPARTRPPAFFPVQQWVTRTRPPCGLGPENCGAHQGCASWSAHYPLFITIDGRPLFLGEQNRLWPRLCNPSAISFFLLPICYATLSESDHR